MISFERASSISAVKLVYAALCLYLSTTNHPGPFNSIRDFFLASLKNVGILAIIPALELSSRTFCESRKVTVFNRVTLFGHVNNSIGIPSFLYTVLLSEALKRAIICGRIGQE